MVNTGKVTRLLRDWAHGDEQARDELVPLVYDMLRRLAAKHLAGERFAATLEPTALVHEAYLRMVDQTLPDWQGRIHFFGVAAHLMRQILVDHARSRRSLKRGGDAVKVDVENIPGLAAVSQGADVVALSDALDALAKLDARKASIIELRHFGGLTEEETAENLGISVATVRRDSRLAEAWLHAEMHPPEKA